MASQPTIAVSAEQLMLSKMQAMQAKVQPPEFIVSDNPLDQQALNTTLSFSQTNKNQLYTKKKKKKAPNQKMKAVKKGQSEKLHGAKVASQ
ncbi:flagellar hook-basal body complex protein FliE, partial [Vibrio parahaemolyticus]